VTEDGDRLTVRHLLEEMGFPGEGGDLDEALRWALVELKLRRADHGVEAMMEIIESTLKKAVGQPLIPDPKVIEIWADKDDPTIMRGIVQVPVNIEYVPVTPTITPPLTAEPAPAEELQFDDPPWTLSNFIQWKGTQVCLDLHCTCGCHSHIDSWFAYYVQCPNCGQVYEMAQEVGMTKVDKVPEGQCKAVVGDRPATWT
jgi:hypothetical protein